MVGAVDFFVQLIVLVSLDLLTQFDLCDPWWPLWPFMPMVLYLTSRTKKSIGWPLYDLQIRGYSRSKCQSHLWEDSCYWKFFKNLDILGQDVNGVGEYFQTKRSCDPRSTWGQKVHFYQKLEIEMWRGLGVAPLLYFY